MGFSRGQVVLPQILSCGIASLFLWGCSPGFKTANNNNGSGVNSKPESSYCGTVSSYSGGITVTATAQFQYRPTDFSLGLSGNPVAAPIPRAEVVVTDSSGQTVQCSETDDNGAISLTLPAGAASYTLKVNSRANNGKIKVSVLADIYDNEPYSLSQSVSVADGQTTINLGTLTAKARMSESSKVEGGAFNILYRIWQANEYLRSTLGDSSFVAPKVTVYWKAGFNPYSYYGYPDTLVSFYRPGLSELYILGGNNGDVKNTDTDHFDHSIILHEYGHFLEDVYAKSESPGGSHNGNFIIDPRLAWSEGWANFFQAAVLRHWDPNWKFYLDTLGYRNDSVEGGNGSVLIKVELTISGSDGRCASSGVFSTKSCDPVSVAGEGTFREMSISRFLYKTLIPSGDGGIEIPFSTIWSAFSSTDSGGSPVGFGSSQIAFKNIGQFNAFLRSRINADHNAKLSSWDSLRGNEQQNADNRDYADSLNRLSENSCATKALSPAVDRADSNGNPRSHLLRSNDFYSFTHDGATKTIKLEYTGGSQHMDLDLYVYSKDYLYLENYQEAQGQTTSSLVGKSARLWSLESGSESVTLSGLPAGRYLIVVKAYTLNKLTAQLTGTANYRLKVTQGSTTEDLCPAN